MSAFIESPTIPSDAEILPGVKFGKPDELLSPAYWRWRCLSDEWMDFDFTSTRGSLREEVGFCILGGFGVTLETNEAFYNLLKKAGVFEEKGSPSQEFVADLLNTPSPIKGKLQRYRFPKQRARRISDAMKNFSELKLEGRTPTDFRNKVSELNGIGPKTASWIARNWFGVDTMAILDIHVLRAGHLIGLFDKNCKLPKDYQRLEKRFLEFAYALEVKASKLDAIIWSDMREFGSRLVNKN